AAGSGRRRHQGGARREPVPVHRVREDTRRGQAGGGAAVGQRMTSVLLDGCYVVTMDGDRAEYSSGHIAIEGNKITSVGAGPAPAHLDLAGARIVDAAGCLATPGLVNTHHHLYQWATRGMAVDSTLFGWLTELYPVWARIDEQVVADSATAALAWL